MCTIGPACHDSDILSKMIDAGMNIARLDFNTFDTRFNQQAIDNLTEVLTNKPNMYCGILMDLKGPQIMTG